MKLRLSQSVIEARLSFLVAVFYIPYINGAATNSRWCLISILFPICLLLLRENKFEIGLVSLLGLCFLGYSALTLTWTYNSAASYEFFKFIILAQAFMIGYCLNTLRNIFVGLALGIGISSLLVLFGIQGGLFININTLAELALLVLIGLIVYREWSYIIFVLPSLFMNGSRGALLTLVLITGVWIFKYSKLTSLALFTLIIGVLFISQYRMETVFDRINIWTETIKGVDILGQGVGAFNLFGFFNINSRPIFAHNDLLQIGFDTGIVGALLVALFFTKLMIVKIKERYVLGTFIIISFFSFPTYLPVSASIALITCGYIANKRNNVFI